MSSRGRSTAGSPGPFTAPGHTPAAGQPPMAGQTAGAVPDVFAQAVAQLRAVRSRPEITLTELPAPQRLAPYAFTLGAVVHREAARARDSNRRRDPTPVEDEEVATGRLILLHDPAEPEPWDGDMRLVCYVTAEVEPDLAIDPLLPEVGWSWLTDGLAAHAARFTALAGTVTQTTSTRFGDLAGPPPAADVEIRASWTPLRADRGPPAASPGASADLEAHALAWCALLSSTAGLPPPGVRALPDRRRGTA